MKLRTLKDEYKDMDPISDPSEDGDMDCYQQPKHLQRPIGTSATCSCCMCSVIIDGAWLLLQPLLHRARDFFYQHCFDCTKIRIHRHTPGNLGKSD